ncbi:MAG TPA: CPBP family glutamic-type intramembrane protease [Pyrinomonadaceae bacterium]|jgi:membrane protease YdiL (CAAX protease family)|nr:CPBP family glutamic-type intramembrane protease [Pyrinomonadaceae bacterium]
MSAESETLNSVPGGQVNKLALWEIVSVVTSCLIAEWVALGFAGGNKLIIAIPILLALGLMAFSHRERGESLRELGFRGDNFVDSCRLLLLPTAVALLTILALGWFTNHAIFTGHLRARFLLLPLWALFQQYALNGFINRRAQLVFGKGLRSITVVAVVFALLHLPNPLLAVATLIGGFIWGAVYQRQPNLFALALSHTVLSITLALSLPPSLLNSLRVGFKYFG